MPQHALGVAGDFDYSRQVLYDSHTESHRQVHELVQLVGRKKGSRVRPAWCASHLYELLPSSI